MIIRNTKTQKLYDVKYDKKTNLYHILNGDTVVRAIIPTYFRDMIYTFKEYKIEKENNERKEFSIKQMDEAINYCWDNNLVMILYPKDMNLIVVDIAREEHCYLSKSIIIDSVYYEKEMLIEEIHSLCNDIYNIGG